MKPIFGKTKRPDAPAEPKPPPPLSYCFMLSHLDEDGPVRLDGVKLGVCEVMGLELDEPKLGAFAGALNALDFPAQLLVRQHAPRLGRLRENLQEAQPESLPPQTKAASESLRRLLTDLERRDGILDRRFYAVCEFGRIDELRGLLARAGLSVHRLKGRQLRMLLLASALGGTPAEFDEDAPVEVEINRRDMRIGGTLVRSLHLGKWPRSLAPGFLQGLMAAGAPMDLSVHVGPIPTEQAARTLEWQKVRFESAQSLSFKRGRTMSPEAEIALEDITRLRDEVQRGRERLFHASLSVTLHAKDEASLKEMTQRAKAHFAATLGKLDNLAFRQREGLLSTLPLALNAVAEWRTLDTSSIARLFPFSPPDMDTRSGTLYGIDMRACSPVVYDPWDGTHLNANTAVLARSGSGKSFATKLGVLRGLTRGITAYVIDPEGEYADMARAAGGRVLSPGVPGEGMNPFVIDKGDSEELLQRIGSLRRLIEVMVGESLGAERRASLDHALAGYYAQPRERTGFRDFYKYLQEDEAGGRGPESSSGQALARLLRPFATGSLRHLLSDEGDDLLGNEALVTVFDLHLLEPELRPAAAMVCTETVWAAAAQDPKPRLLVVDEVWSIMQHPEGAAFMVSMAKRARKHRLGLQFITQDVQDLLSEDTSRTITGHSGRALLQNAAFKLLLQQDAAAPRRAGALPPRLGPVAARPDGAPRRPGRRISPGLPPLQRRLPHTLPLVPGRAAGRRRDASRWEDGRHRQAGTHRRPVRLRQAALAAARRADARSGARPHGRRHPAQARPQAALDHRGPDPVRPGARRCPGRSGRPDMEPAQGRRFRRPALRPRPDRPRRRASRRGRAAARLGPRRHPRQGGGV